MADEYQTGMKIVLCALYIWHNCYFLNFQGCEDPLVQCVTYLCSLPKLLKGEKADITVVAEIGGNHFRSAGKEMFLEVTVLSSAELLSAIATKDGMLLDMTSPEMRSTKVSTPYSVRVGSTFDEG